MIRIVFAAVVALVAVRTTTAEETARLRGFNLLGMLSTAEADKAVAAGKGPDDVRCAGRFSERDFRWMRGQGFNFARLPLDYRFLFDAADLRRENDDGFRNLDEAVAFGRRYGVHVQVCFHRAPGYCVLDGDGTKPLFTDAAIQRDFAYQWSVLARRYRGISNEELSFNLFNEPACISATDYTVLARMLVEAIRAEDPERLIYADGLNWGRTPCAGIDALRGVRQATRGYDPVNLTHYRRGNYTAEPIWPVTPDAPCGLWQKGVRLTLLDAPQANYRLDFGRNAADCEASFLIAADGVRIASFSIPAATNGFSQAFALARPAGRLEVICKEASGGIYPGNLFLEGPGGERAALGISVSWEAGLARGWQPMSHARQRFLGWASVPVSFREDGADAIPWTSTTPGEEYLARHTYSLWDARKDAEHPMVGEFGLNSTVPSAVALAFLEDCLKVWKTRGWGWAMWELRGHFGIVCNKRPGAVYENVDGYLVDVKMLELLRRY